VLIYPGCTACWLTPAALLPCAPTLQEGPAWHQCGLCGANSVGCPLLRQLATPPGTCPHRLSFCSCLVALPPAPDECGWVLKTLCAPSKRLRCTDRFLHGHCPVSKHLGCVPVKI